MSVLSGIFGLSDDEVRRTINEHAASRRASRAAELAQAWAAPWPHAEWEGHRGAECGCVLRGKRIVTPCKGLWAIHDAIAELRRMDPDPGIRALIERGEAAWDRHVDDATGEERRKWKRPPKREEA